MTGPKSTVVHLCENVFKTLSDDQKKASSFQNSHIKWTSSKVAVFVVQTSIFPSTVTQQGITVQANTKRDFHIENDSKDIQRVENSLFMFLSSVCLVELDGKWQKGWSLNWNNSGNHPLNVAHLDGLSLLLSSDKLMFLHRWRTVDLGLYHSFGGVSQRPVPTGE